MSDLSNTGQRVRSRLVINFPGFEKTDSQSQLGRLLYSAQNTGSIWGFSVDQSPGATSQDGRATLASHHIEGGNWSVETDVVQLRWNDIVDAYENAPFPAGFLRDFGKFLAFFTDGTVGRYFSTSKRYWGFTIYPLVLIVLFAAVTGYLWWTVTGIFGLEGWAQSLFVILLTMISCLILCKWPGEKLYMTMTIADWGFARDMVNRTNPEIEDRFGAFASVTLDEISRSNHDEIVIVGHSFGAVWAVEALARALRRDASLLTGKRLTFLALGSSIGKIALAPNADWLRQSVEQVAAQPQVFWHDVQTKDDFIAFYKSDPFESLKVAPPKDYLVERIRFSKGIEKKRYKAIRRSMYRTHRQYILHYDKRVSFDTMLKLFGPFSAKTLAKRPELPETLDAQGFLAEIPDKS